MESAQVGLDYIVESPDYIEKLASALDSKNYVVKKQVFELLSTLSVYSNEGYLRTLQALEYFKKQTGERYRFKFIILELRNAHSVEYQTAVLAFINCLILVTPNLQERVRVRSEFIGLRLMNVLGDLRHQNTQSTDLVVQLDVFDEQKESDDSNLSVSPTSEGIDLSSPLEVFDLIIRQIADTPQETPFLCILQHLLRIDAKEPISDLIWDTAEKLVHRATLLESSEDAQRLLNAPTHSKSSSLLKTKENGVPPPPPPPNGTPPPPPLPIGMGTPPPPPLPNGISAPPGPPTLPSFGNNNKSSTLILPQQNIPIPKAKMRTVNWSKIPRGQILNGDKNNIWATLAKSHSSSKVDLDWGALEGMFCIQREKPALTTNQTKNDDLDRKYSKKDELILLDAKRSLNINIYIKQFKSSNDDMIQLILRGSSEDFGSERLRGLLKILPSLDEISILESVSSEDKHRLATAEKFLIQIIKVKGYRLRIEAMLLKEELEACVRSIEFSIKSILKAARDVKTSQELQEVIYMILVAGNFLNSGGYAGDAAGVKLSSLQKIAEIRGNKPGIYLLHFIAMQAETKNPRLISFVDDMVALEESSKTSVDQLNTEILALKAKVTNISQQMENPSVPSDIISQFSDLFKEADSQIERLKSLLPKVEDVRVDIAQFFCEDLHTFKLEDCFKILFTFTKRWKAAATENLQRKKREKEAELRKQIREDQFKKRSQLGWKNPAEVVSLNHENKNKVSLTPDDEIFIACSPRIVRRRLGGSTGSDNNSSTNGQVNPDNLALPSPETTPNGSFRRRRSRAPSDEDEAGLMDFLQVSGVENPTDKRPASEQYGSLDRSWSRKTRRRPNLLDFVNDERERTVSPAPGYHQDFKPSAITPTVQIERLNPDTKPESPAREWRERIAAWFVDLENGGSGEIPKRQSPPPRRFLQRRLGQDSRLDAAPRNLATLPEGDVGQEEDNLVLRAYQRVYPDRKPSLKLNTDVLSAMEAIEEVQFPIKDTKEKSLWRRPSLITNENNDEKTKIEPPAKNLVQESRRALIGTLGNQSSDDDKLVLYMSPAQSESTNKRLSPDEPSKEIKSTNFDNDVAELSAGTQEGFDRFASIRRSRRIKRPEMSTPALPRKTSRFISKVDITNEPAATNVLVNENKVNNPPGTKSVKPRESSDSRNTKFTVEPVKIHFDSNTFLNKTDQRTSPTIPKSPTTTTLKSPITFSIGQKVDNKSRTTAVTSSYGTTEHDEGFEESQSSLSETNSLKDSLSLNGFQKIARSPLRQRRSFKEPSKITIGEGNWPTKPTMTILSQSPVVTQIRRKSLQENLPVYPPGLTVNNNNNSSNNNNNNNASSRSSLLSSKSSLTSQTTVNTVRDMSESNNSKLQNSFKPKDPVSNSNQKRSILNSSSKTNGHAPRTIMISSKNVKSEPPVVHEQDNSNSNEQSSPKVKSNTKGLGPRFLSFMRPTASSSAKDKLDPPKSKGVSARKSFK